MMYKWWHHGQLQDKVSSFLSSILKSLVVNGLVEVGDKAMFVTWPLYGDIMVNFKLTTVQDGVPLWQVWLLQPARKRHSAVPN